MGERGSGQFEVRGLAKPEVDVYADAMIRLSALLALFTAAVIALPAAQPGAYSPTIKVTPLMQTQVDGAGRKLAYPTAAAAEVTAVLVEIPPGMQSNWHKHPVPCFAYMLEGELHIEIDGGEVKVVKAGEAFPEVVDLLHNGINRGKTPVKLVMFVVGTVGQPYAVRAPAAAKS